MENLHIKLLKEFEKTGLSSKRSISKFIAFNFVKPTSDVRDEWIRQNSAAHLFLNDIRHIGHFDIEDYELAGIKFDDRRWFDKVDINARITVDGLAYLDAYRTNNRITKNSNLQTIAIALTVIITGANLILTLQNSISNKTIDRLQTRIQTQTQQLHTLKIELSQATNTLPLEKEAKKTSPKKN